jgi:hypothetical protein
MNIDITFNFYSDSNGGDPDLKSPTLRKYHQFLWHKRLPNGDFMDLLDTPANLYLAHKSRLESLSLGSDSIVHSYKNQVKKQWLISKIPEREVDELRNLGSTIGGYILFPNKKINDLFTINQARGVNKYIDDRFDLTLECIRRYYLGQESPLYDTLLRYKHFFDLFGSFTGYCRFFLLEDLLDENNAVKFYLPFDNFKSQPTFNGISDYLMYKKGVMDFVTSRNKRIIDYSNHS